MKLEEIVHELNLRELTPEVSGDASVELVSGHASDLLSEVLTNAPSGSVLVTTLVHMNVIAVSVNASVAAVVFASGAIPDEAVRRKAVEEGIWLYASEESTFNIVGRLYELGLRGRHA